MCFPVFNSKILEDVKDDDDEPTLPYEVDLSSELDVSDKEEEDGLDDSDDENGLDYSHGDIKGEPRFGYVKDTPVGLEVSALTSIILPIGGYFSDIDILLGCVTAKAYAYLFMDFQDSENGLIQCRVVIVLIMDCPLAKEFLECTIYDPSLLMNRQAVDFLDWGTSVKAGPFYLQFMGSVGFRKIYVEPQSDSSNLKIFGHIDPGLHDLIRLIGLNHDLILRNIGFINSLTVK